MSEKKFQILQNIPKNIAIIIEINYNNVMNTNIGDKIRTVSTTAVNNEEKVLSDLKSKNKPIFLKLLSDAIESFQKNINDFFDFIEVPIFKREVKAPENKFTANERKTLMDKICSNKNLNKKLNLCIEKKNDYQTCTIAGTEDNKQKKLANYNKELSGLVKDILKDKKIGPIFKEKFNFLSLKDDMRSFILDYQPKYENIKKFMEFIKNNNKLEEKLNSVLKVKQDEKALSKAIINEFYENIRKNDNSLCAIIDQIEGLKDKNYIDRNTFEKFIENNF